MYIPTFTVNLKDKPVPKIRLLLQGEPGTGKTFSAVTTFPNPYVLDMNSGMTAFAGQDIPTAPFHDYNFVCSYKNGAYKPVNNVTGLKVHPQPNRRDAVLDFIENEAVKFSENQTLVFDGITDFEAAIGQQEIFEEKKTFDKATGTTKVNDYYPWNQRIKCYSNLMTFLKSLPCHCVIICHESKVRDKETGRLLDRVSPLMQGGFIAQLQGHFTDVFRTIAEDKKDANGKVIKTEYFWQVRTDSIFRAKTRLAIPEGIVYEQPSFEIFTKYKLVDPKNPYNTK